ncbi:MAG: 3-aminobutyryl-CoA ammonia lyase [Nitrosopumilus sp.]|nr:3-aminobutyryl-CoA ammonia lyase [Nitrosopumilus sp.]MDH3385007.1 3-aminobutyryl-CoA ammonia lyase [Nitrosopumilus sp.]
MEIFPKVKLRVRISQNDAHYAGNLLDGAHIMQLFGDVATELTIRYDGDEGLLRAYESVEFLQPVHGGDFLEVFGKIINVGNTSRKILFEAFKIISSSNNVHQESACDVLTPPILVAKAIGTCVVTKDKQRSKKQLVESSDDQVIDDFNKIKTGEPSRMSHKNKR